MLRTFMRGLVALMLVATLLLPAVTVGAQDEEIDASQAPVTTEETIPESEPPPVEVEPPIVEPQPEAPAVEDPVVEEPVIDEPAIEEPVSEEPLAQEPVTEDPVLEPDNSDTEAPSDPVDGEGTEATDEEESEDAAEETEAEETPPDDSVDEAAVATVISGASLNCDGTLTFTIAEAAEETLTISFRNLHAPSIGQDMGSVSFPVTGTGTFQVSVAVADFVDVFQADITSPLAGNVIGQAAAYGCISGEEQTLGGISDMTLSCAGVTTFTIGAIDGSVSIQLYDGSTNPHTLIDSESLGYIINGGGESRTVDFGIPADTYDSLIVRARAHNNWGPLDIAYATDCVTDEEPEPDETTVSNLRLFCNGLVRFDLTTEETATVDIFLTTIAPTPEFERSAQLSGGTGSYEHQFGVPAAWYNDFAVTISQGGEVLGETSIFGCLETDPNGVTGEEILVFTRSGSVIFERVTAGGETIIDTYWQPNPPALPEGFGEDGSTYFDLSTTTTHVGTIEVCLNLSQPFIENSDGVRLLQYLGGDWVDVTTSVQTDLGRACGVVTSLSTFAIARQLDDPDPEPEPDDDNTPTGRGVVVEVGGGTITFDDVATSGETTVTVLDPNQAPPLPAQYQNGPVILLDIASTASFTGSATICLPVATSFGSLDGVRMLHYESGAWVDVTLSVDQGSRTVCGQVTHLSPFAIVRLADDTPGKPEHPGKPGGPGKPGHHGKPGWHHPRPQGGGAASSVQLTSLPNTGSGAQPSPLDGQTAYLLLGVVGLFMAIGLRGSTPGRDGARSR